MVYYIWILHIVIVTFSVIGKKTIEILRYKKKELYC